MVACLQCSLQKGRLDTVAPIGRPVETDCWKKLLEAWAAFSPVLFLHCSGSSWYESTDLWLKVAAADVFFIVNGMNHRYRCMLVCI